MIQNQYQNNNYVDVEDGIRIRQELQKDQCYIFLIQNSFRARIFGSSVLFISIIFLIAGGQLGTDNPQSPARPILIAIGVVGLIFSIIFMFYWSWFITVKWVNARTAVQRSNELFRYSASSQVLPFPVHSSQQNIIQRPATDIRSPQRNYDPDLDQELPPQRTSQSQRTRPNREWYDLDDEDEKNSEEDDRLGSQRRSKRGSKKKRRSREQNQDRHSLPSDPPPSNRSPSHHRYDEEQSLPVYTTTADIPIAIATPVVDVIEEY